MVKDLHALRVCSQLKMALGRCRGYEVTSSCFLLLEALWPSMAIRCELSKSDVIARAHS